MDLNRKQLVLRKGQENNNGEEDDRISKLPDSLLHHILSFIDDIKHVARSSLLVSKRWKYIWTSIPTLVFPLGYPYSMSESQTETNKFMNFVDRTLLLHDGSDIKKFHLETNKHMTAPRVHSWIEKVTMHNVEELDLRLDDIFVIPSSLFTCKSLITLKITVSNGTILPRSFAFPKLKSLTLSGVQFTGDCWNEQTFTNCRVLENLSLEDCSLSNMRNFCISIPTLKLLKVYTWDEYGLQGCDFKINAPNLVSLTYCGRLAKEYILSSFKTLEYAEVLFCKYDIPMEQKTGYGAAARKFFRTLSHVQKLVIYAETFEALSIMDDLVNILPTFYDLKEMTLIEGETTDKSLFLLLKAVPNLRSLLFSESYDIDMEQQHSWPGHMLTAGCMLQNLESVTFEWFSGNARQMRWLKLILKNAKALKTVRIESIYRICVKSKEVIMSELLSLPRASDRCEFEIKGL